MNVLVIRGGALGDFILTLPALASLRSRFPESRLEILGYPGIAALAVGAGLADDVLPLESTRFTGFFVENGSWTDDVTAWLAKFDCIISYLHDPRGIFRANVARCGPARFIAGPHRPDETLGVHAAEQLLRPLSSLVFAVPSRSRNYPGRLPMPNGWRFIPAAGVKRKIGPKKNGLNCSGRWTLTSCSLGARRKEIVAPVSRR